MEAGSYDPRIGKHIFDVYDQFTPNEFIKLVTKNPEMKKFWENLLIKRQKQLCKSNGL